FSRDWSSDVCSSDLKNEFNIGKVVAKNPIAKAAFDNDPQLQNSKDSKINVVISCHPYDIIGMSTGRDWDRQSCMRLDDAISNKRSEERRIGKDSCRL